MSCQNQKAGYFISNLAHLSMCQSPLRLKLRLRHWAQIALASLHACRQADTTCRVWHIYEPLFQSLQQLDLCCHYALADLTTLSLRALHGLECIMQGSVRHSHLEVDHSSMYGPVVCVEIKPLSCLQQQSSHHLTSDPAIFLLNHSGPNLPIDPQVR